MPIWQNKKENILAYANDDVCMQSEVGFDEIVEMNSS